MSVIELVFQLLYLTIDANKYFKEVPRTTFEITPSRQIFFNFTPSRQKKISFHVHDSYFFKKEKQRLKIKRDKKSCSAFFTS